MKTDNETKLRTDRVWLSAERCFVDDLASLVAQQTDLARFPLAAEVASRVLVYDGDAVRAAVDAAQTRRELMAEWAEALMAGPGILVIRGMFSAEAVDAVTPVFHVMIEAERAAGMGGGDHFAKPGANDRVWNALEKLCLRDPAAFAAYYGNAALAAVCEAWLGPAYQVTSQVNVVNPGGAAQLAHRDYHLGFQSADTGARYPAHVHRLSPALTLQGAVAHCDMPVETGPTLYLPYSQLYEPGYLATARPEFAAFFQAHHVQLPLTKGDGAFFNPALLHAAGHNRSADVRRMANLLQVSSAFGRAMESVDRVRMCEALFPVLRPGPGTEWAVAACAEGYSFPTNLDRDPPIGGLAPQTQQALMRMAVDEGWSPARFGAALAEQAARRLA